MDTSPRSSPSAGRPSTNSSRRKPDLSLLRIKSPKDYLNMFREWWHVGVVLGVLVGAGVAVKEIRKPPRYESTASLKFETNATRVLEGMSRVTEQTLGNQTELNTHIYQIRSGQFFDFISNTLTREEIERIQRPYIVNGDAASAPSPAAIIRPNIAVNNRVGTTILDIQAFHRDPEVAQMIAAKFARKYIEYNIDLSERTTDSAIQFLQGQADALRRKLDQAETASRNFRKKYNMTTLTDNRNVILQKAQNLSSSVVGAEMDRINAQGLIDGLDRVEKAKQDYLSLPFISGAPEIAGLIRTIEGLKAAQVILEEKYLRKHPKMIANRNAIEAAQQQLDTAVKKAVDDIRKRYAFAKEQEARLKAELEEANKAAIELDKIADEYKVLERDSAIASGNYEKVLVQLHEKRITKQLDNTLIKEMDQAYVNSTPIEPNPTAAAFKAAFLGCFIFLVIPVVIGTFDTRLKSAKEIEEILALNLLGEIPRVAVKDPKLKMRLVDNNEDEIAVESFRGMYGQLRLTSTVKLPKIILVTSTIPAEGKSLVAANFACTAATHGHRVLLVDADFRRPTLNGHFTHKAGHGVLKYLHAPDAKIENVLQDPLLAIEPVRENLWFLASGGASRKPTEFFEGDKFRGLLNRLRTSFDLVVIDTPPVGVFADALMLAPACDEVVYVARFKKVWRARVNNFVERMNASGTPIAGIVMNDLPPGIQSVGYDYYGYGTAAKEYQKYYAEKKS